MALEFSLIFFKELTSTNSQASIMLKEGLAAQGCVIYTDYQTTGKGRAGNKWESEKGKNLLFSIILIPNFISPEDQFLISMAISLGVCDFTDSHFLESKIKWPNDIYINDDKIAGILIENSILGGTVENTIAGIGVNINQIVFPPSVPNPVSLSILTGREYDRKACLEELITCLGRRYEILMSGKPEQIRRDYLSHLYRLNEWHFYRSGGKQFRGIIKGISVFGKLIVEDDNARATEFDFKEIEYVR
jgi:BirA family transcriptional regulator, biotin operon repressor / biotin---[acetyl-CoA-carboxylase] ligase